MRTRQALAIVVAGLAIAVPPVAVARDTVDPIVSSYARDLGISTAAAVSNLSAQDQLGQLNATLLAAESETYAGMWLEHGADGVKAVTFFTSDPGKTLGPYLQSAELSGSIEARTAKRSLADLERDANDFRSRFGTVPFDLEIDVLANVILVTSPSGAFDRFVVSRLLDVPSSFERREGPISAPAADIYAGLYPPGCGTTGFTVSNGSMTGITTAGHCGPTVSYQGTTLPQVAERFTGSYDVQWHTTPGFVDRPWANDGDGQVRGITGYIHRNSQPNNSYYCKYGSTTKFGCGFVVANNFSPSYVPNASATFMRLYNPDGVDLASGGDSGGPVYTPTKAVGIISGSLGNDAIYMAANYIVSGLSLSILTT